MMHSRLTACLLVITVCGVLFSCDRDYNPVSSHANRAVSGTVVTSVGSIGGASVTLSGENTDLCGVCDAGGGFLFSDVPPGKYSVCIEKENFLFSPEAQEIIVGASSIPILLFFGYDTSILPESAAWVCGKVTLENGNPVWGVSLSDETGAQRAMTDAQGYFNIQAERGKRYTLVPAKVGYAYTFSPSRFEVETDKPLSVCLFSAVYTGKPLHTIRGRVLDVNGAPVNIRVELSGKAPIVHKVDDSGKYVFEDVAPGTYTIRFNGGPYSYTPDPLTVVVDDKDVVAPDAVAVYDAETKYLIEGRVINTRGKGVSQITLDVDGMRIFGVRETNPKGAYSFQAYVGIFGGDTNVITIRPRREGCIFSPDSLSVTIQKQPREFGGVIMLPSFIATDYTTFTPIDYFPLSATSSWTYSRTVNLLPTVDHTITASGTLAQGGQSYRTLSPTGPAGFTAYRVEGNSVYTLLDNAAVELLRFGVIPGTSWEIGKSGGYPLKGTFVGLETVTVPAGTFPDCLRFQVRKEYGATTHETYTLWFAEGVGMVRSEKALVNYGAEKERVVDELK